MILRVAGMLVIPCMASMEQKETTPNNFGHADKYGQVFFFIYSLLSLTKSSQQLFQISGITSVLDFSGVFFVQEPTSFGIISFFSTSLFLVFMSPSIRFYNFILKVSGQVEISI